MTQTISNPKAENVNPIESHPCKLDQDENIRKVCNDLGNWIIDQSLQITSGADLTTESLNNVFLMTGPMAAGKSTVLATVSNIINKYKYRKIPVFVFGLNDGRASDHVFNRNGIKTESELIKRPIQNIRLITERILRDETAEVFPKGSVIFVSEGQFLADDKDQINELVKIALSKGILIVFDCLEKFYNGVEIPITSHIKTIAGETAQMFACDNFSEGRAYETLRFTRVDFSGGFVDDNVREIDGEMKLRNDGANYLMKKTPTERKDIVRRIRRDPNLKKFVKNGYVLIPSHATEDDSYVLGGNELYASGNIDNVMQMFSNIDGLSEITNSYQAVAEG